MAPGLALSPDLLALLDLLFLCGFMGLGSTLMLVTVINRQRVRGVELSWLRPRHGPVWIAAVALSAVLLLLLVALQNERAAQAVRLAGYAAGCGFFLVVALLSGTTLATRRGLVKNVNRRWTTAANASAAQTLAWHTVRDYFVHEKKGGTHRYVFFFVKSGTRQRFEVTVPAACAEAFARLVRRKVDRRLERRTPHAREGRTRLSG